MVSTLDIFSRQHIGDSLFFSNKHLETICMKCQILFSREKYENVQIVCWNKIQHTTFWNSFLIFPRKQKPVFVFFLVQCFRRNFTGLGVFFCMPFTALEFQFGFERSYPCIIDCDNALLHFIAFFTIPLQEITGQFSHTFFTFWRHVGHPPCRKFSHLQTFRTNTMNWPMTYVQLLSNFITCISSVIVKQLCYILHNLMSRRTQSPSAHVLVANSSSSIVEFSYTSFDELYASRRSDPTSLSAFWISIALIPRLASVLIYAVCLPRVNVTHRPPLRYCRWQWVTPCNVILSRTNYARDINQKSCQVLITHDEK